MKKIAEIENVDLSKANIDKFNVNIKLDVCVPRCILIDGVRKTKDTDTISIPIATFIARVLNQCEPLASLHKYMKVQASRNDNVVWDANAFAECIKSVTIIYNQVSMSDTYRIGDKEINYAMDGFDIGISNIILNDGIEDICKKVSAKSISNMVNNFALAGL